MTRGRVSSERLKRSPATVGAFRLSPPYCVMSRKQVLSERQLLLGTIAGAFLFVLAAGCTSYTEPTWTSVAKVEGRNYVTDGNIAIDMKLIEVSQPPPLQSTSKWFSESLFQNLRADTPEQFNLDEIRASDGNAEIVLGPGEQQLSSREVHNVPHREAFLRSPCRVLATQRDGAHGDRRRWKGRRRDESLELALAKHRLDKRGPLLLPSSQVLRDGVVYLGEAKNLRAEPAGPQRAR